jgi:hypothetical protein
MFYPTLSMRTLGITGATLRAYAGIAPAGVCAGVWSQFHAALRTEGPSRPDLLRFLARSQSPARFVDALHYPCRI